MKLKTLIQSTRVPFLILTPACVLLGVSTVVANHISVNITFLMLALLGAVLAHISVNTFNEYFDFRSGLDFNTTKTPFSGGSGALIRNPDMANGVFAMALVSLAATTLIGFFFVWQYGLGIIPVGIAGLVLLVTYTSWINKHPLICLIAPGTGFGLLMVVGTQYVLEGYYSNLSWLVALVPFFLVNNLLLLNQYPDIQADKEAGRYNFPIAHGTRLSSRVFAVFVLATMAVIVACVMTGAFPVLSLIALLPMPLAGFAYVGAMKYGPAIGAYPQYLGANVAVAVLTPVLLGVSIILGS